tara:strand:+ start:551 stop:1318 length:768 start_codon:yes stop_codon:yes gene_type:complete
MKKVVIVLGIVLIFTSLLIMGYGDNWNKITGRYVPPPVTYCVDDCSDGTSPGQCSSDRPKYCLYEVENLKDCGLVEDCQRCGCDNDYICLEGGSCSYQPSDDEDYECSSDYGCEENEVCVNYNCVALPSIEKPESPEDVVDLLNLNNQFKREELNKEILEKVFNIPSSEKSIINFIIPSLTKNLFEKPDIFIYRESEYSEIKKSPGVGEVIIVEGLIPLEEGVYLSPGEREKDFRMLLGTKDNAPYISLDIFSIL